MVNFKCILSTIIWLPIIIGLVLLLINNKKLIYIGLLFGIINFILSLVMLKNFNITGHGWQFVEYYKWLPNIGVYYALGVDGFSVSLITLSCIINLLTLITSLNSGQKTSQYMGYFLIMNGLINGVFAATNAILFYMFFEVMLIPLFLIIGIWGGSRKFYATIKFFLYTFLGSILFLIAVIYLHKAAVNNGLSLEQSFNIVNLYSLKLSLQQQTWLFVALFVAFAIKIPMVPFHTWLPDAHVEAPLEGSIILAAITLKVGAFAMLRFLLPIVPNACLLLAKVGISLSLIAIIYVGFIVIYQKNLKKLIAYSSIVHMGFVTLGFFTAIILAKEQHVNQAILSINGSLIQMIAHGLISASLFMAVGALSRRTYSYNIADFGGIINAMPIFSKLFILICLANVALPGTIGFVGEFFIILASTKINYLIPTIAGISLLLYAGYTLPMYKKVVLGEADIKIKILPDLNFQETISLGCGVFLIILLGVMPRLIINILNNSALDLIKGMF